LAEFYNGLGIDYLTFNNRGSELMKKVKKTNGSKEIIGYTYEIFEQCLIDVEAAIAFVKENYSEVILQGHSSGCQKILYAISTKKLPVSAIILLSPCDDRGLAIDHFGKEKFIEMINFANNYKGTLLPIDFFFDTPVSKKTFLNHYGQGNNFDIFHYWDSERDFKELTANHLPTLVMFGENDYVLDWSIIEKLYNGLQNYSLRIIPGAQHNYKGQETRLSKNIKDFLDAKLGKI
jgi:alpha-beta hydrolase superfamily lysophospholipase